MIVQVPLFCNSWKVDTSRDADESTTVPSFNIGKISVQSERWKRSCHATASSSFSEIINLFRSRKMTERNVADDEMRVTDFGCNPTEVSRTEQISLAHLDAAFRLETSRFWSTQVSSEISISTSWNSAKLPVPG